LQSCRSFCGRGRAVHDSDRGPPVARWRIVSGSLTRRWRSARTLERNA
jgi:hypothetical protein